MAIPRGPEARLFYRCAIQRHEESVVLLEAGYTTGALYLAGYSVECILKSLVLAGVPENVYCTHSGGTKGTILNGCGLSI